MNEQPTPIVEDKFGLRDEEYWTDPWRNRRALQRPLMQESREGLALGTPRLAAMDQQPDMPVALLRVCKASSTAALPSHAYLMLAAVDLYTWELRAQLALPPRPRAVASTAARAAPAAPDSFPGDATAMLSEGHTVDLAALLRLPAARREYLVTAILLDQVSNRSRAKRVESAGYEDPAADAFLREYLARRMTMPAVYPGEASPLPNYRRQEQSPAIPADPGIVISVPRVSVLDAQSTCILHASYRLQICGQHVVRPGDPWRPPLQLPAETARIPITLLLTGSADPRPRILRLVVPCYQPLDASAGQKIAIGHFSLDLCRMAELSITPQTYFIYAFAGEVMSAAVPAAFVRLPLEEPESADSW